MSNILISTVSRKVDSDSASSGYMTGYAINEDGKIDEGVVDAPTNIASVVVLVYMLTQFVKIDPLREVCIALRMKWSVNAITNPNMLTAWANNGWKTSKGKTLRHAEVWEAFYHLQQQCPNITIVHDNTSDEMGELTNLATKKLDLEQHRLEATVASDERAANQDETPLAVEDDNVPPPLDYSDVDATRVYMGESDEDQVEVPAAEPKPSATPQQEAVGTTSEPLLVFMHGRGYTAPDAVLKGRELITALQRKNGVLVTTDDPVGMDRFFIIEAAKQNVPTVVVGLGESPRGNLPDGVSYRQYTAAKPDTPNALALYQRNYSAANRCGASVLFVTNERYAESVGKFATRVKTKLEKKATVYQF